MIYTTSKKKPFGYVNFSAVFTFSANLDPPHFGPVKTITLTTRMLRPTQTQTQTQTPTPKDMACEFGIWKIGSVTCDIKVIV